MAWSKSGSRCTWIISIIFFSNVLETWSCIGIPDNHCACVYNDLLIDLNVGDIPVPLVASSNSSDSKDLYTYYVNPCKLLLEPTSLDVNCDKSSLCQKDVPYDDKSSQWYPIGSYTIEYTGVPNRDLQFHYGSQLFEGVYRGSVINIVCDEDQPVETLTFDGEHKLNEEVTEFSFTLRGDACCPIKHGGPNTALSAGSILLILFFVLLVVYFCGGMLFNKIGRGYTGVEIIPNYEFWSDLPKLVMDGWKFTITCGCRSTEESDPAYDNI
ncbi:uncharacterized protein [Watersipora subatra]|uniref:uncharacterized protein n=1 Tax=Watersipora subatra TaxID=2589382 RepID=UPI00355AD080